MADNPITVVLPADLPEDWTTGQTVAPTGAEVGLSQQHGYNYLMEQVNNAQKAVNQIGAAWDTLGGFIENETAVPVAQRKANTLYGVIMADYGGEIQ